MYSQGVGQDLVALTGPQAKSNVTQSSPSMCPNASRNQAGPALVNHLTTGGEEGCEARLNV